MWRMYLCHRRGRATISLNASRHRLIAFLFCPSLHRVLLLLEGWMAGLQVETDMSPAVREKDISIPSIDTFRELFPSCPDLVNWDLFGVQEYLALINKSFVQKYILTLKVGVGIVPFVSPPVNHLECLIIPSQWIQKDAIKKC